jgi:AcrR family transcriptional regulator
MKTSEKILETALFLFNRDGFSNTTLRGIAQEMGISQGNLNYHYKTKEELVEKLYMDLASKMDERVSFFAMQAGYLGLLYESSVQMMQTLYSYRFFMRDFYVMMRQFPNIRLHYTNLQKKRAEEFATIFTFMIKEDILREPEFDSEYHHLYKRMQLIGDNWINDVELIEQKQVDDLLIRAYAKILFEIIYPYLTSKGKDLWKQL